MNDTIKTIATRFSCRSFTAEKPAKADLQQIAEAAVQAPSAMNLQPWDIYVVTDEALLADLEAAGMEALAQMEDKSALERITGRGGKVFYGAPAMFVVAAAPDNELDCGIVSENIALAASALGYGNVICGLARLAFDGPKKAEFARRVGFKEGTGFVMSVLVGCAAAEAAPHQPDLAKIHFVE